MRYFADWKIDAFVRFRARLGKERNAQGALVGAKIAKAGRFSKTRRGIFDSVAPKILLEAPILSHFRLK